MEDQTPPPAAGPAGPQHPSPFAAPPTARPTHWGVIIGSIVGGVVLLCLTFAGGATVGWWLGSHHGGPSITIHGPGLGGDDLPPGWGPDERRGHDDQDQQLPDS